MFSLKFSPPRPFVSTSLLLFSALLAGCVTDQSAPVASAPVPRSQASITITRTGGYYASAVDADIDANGKRFASLAKEATFTGGVQPGPVTLTVTCWCGPGRYSIQFNAQAGKHYAFEVSPRDEQFVATVAGGLVGVVAETAISGEKSGSFKIVAVPGT
jgi:hypothetical protein